MSHEAHYQNLFTLNLPANCFRRSRALCGSPMSENNEKTEREWRWCVYPWVWQHTRACAQHGHSRRIYFFIFVFFELYISRFLISVLHFVISAYLFSFPSSNCIECFSQILFIYSLSPWNYIFHIFSSPFIFSFSPPLSLIYVIFLSHHTFFLTSSKYVFKNLHLHLHFLHLHIFFPIRLLRIMEVPVSWCICSLQNALFLFVLYKLKDLFGRISKKKITRKSHWECFFIVYEESFFSFLLFIGKGIESILDNPLQTYDRWIPV